MKSRPDDVIRLQKNHDRPNVSREATLNTSLRCPCFGIDPVPAGVVSHCPAQPKSLSKLMEQTPIVNARPSPMLQVPLEPCWSTCRKPIRQLKSCQCMVEEKIEINN